MSYPHLFARLYNTPLLLLPEKARVIEGVFQSQLLGQGVRQQADSDGTRPAAALGDGQPNRKPYAITESGIAVIPVMGTLVQRASGLDAMSGLMSYGRVGGLLNTALADSDVRAILLEIDSPGGEVYGLFDLVDRIYAGREQKPIWGVANEMAFSAAYAIASSVERLTMPRTAGVGSIGVIALHVEQSKRDASQGYVYTPVFAGAKKNDLSSHAPLSQSALGDLQSEVDRLYEIFVSAVARNRSVDAKAVRDTEAGCLNPDQAIALGLADATASFSDTLGMLEDKLRAGLNTSIFLPTASQAVHSQEFDMSDKNNAPGSGAPAASAEIDAARAQGYQSGLAEGTAAGTQAGAAAERARIGAIINHANAEGRGKQASTIALSTDLTVDAAAGLLAVSPKETVAAANPLATLMAGVPNPAVATAGADAGGSDEASKAAQMAAQIINAGKVKALAS